MSSGNSDWILNTENAAHKIVNVHINVGDTWNNVSASNNLGDFDSIFNKVDKNKDGIIQQEEKDTLKKIFKTALNSTSNDVQETSEETTQRTKPETLGIYGNEKDCISKLDDESIQKIADLDENADYNYMINEQTTVSSDGTTKKTPLLSKTYKRIAPVKSKQNNWSEQIFGRKMGGAKVYIHRPVYESDSYSDNESTSAQYQMFVNTMEQAAKENGFELRQLSGTGANVFSPEDSAPLDYEGKKLVTSDKSIENLQPYIKKRAQQMMGAINLGQSPEIDKIIKHRVNISSGTQGNALDSSTNMAKLTPQEDLHRIDSYIEGGNLLNTRKADGTPAAVVGSETIDYTLLAMNLDNTPQNVEKAKAQIAKDLGLKQGDVTFMPQFDFHIDMYYRPLHNGEMAVPDYDEGIKILQNTNISGMSDEQKQTLIKQMQEMNKKTAKIRKQATQELINNGYKIVKMPTFICNDSNYNDSQNSFLINYMNGIGGEAADGKNFYITNDSGYPELNSAVQKYFENIGVDRMYFAPTSEYLRKSGGVDCLTMEQPE